MKGSVTSYGYAAQEYCLEIGAYCKTVLQKCPYDFYLKSKVLGQIFQGRFPSST